MDDQARTTHLNGEEGRKRVLPGPIHPHRLDYWHSRHKSRVPVRTESNRILWWTNYRKFLSNNIDQNIPSGRASMMKWGCELSKSSTGILMLDAIKVSSLGRKQISLLWSGPWMPQPARSQSSCLDPPLPPNCQVSTALRSVKSTYKIHPKPTWLSNPVVSYIVVFKRVPLTWIKDLFRFWRYCIWPEACWVSRNQKTIFLSKLHPCRSSYPNRPNMEPETKHPHRNH